MTSQKLEGVTSLNYPEAPLYKKGICSAENYIRIASAMAAVAKQNQHQLRNKLHTSLFTTTLLYGCEKWTLLADSEKRIEAKLFPHLLLGAQDQRLGGLQDQLPCGPTGTSSGNR